ncbi:MAG: hypothetical protein ACFB2X_08360 [Rivularia sp. (in: cyanobacteria)]
MKILYLMLPLWILVALSSFVQNSIPQALNQFDTYKKVEKKPSKEKKEHRGSGRRYIKVDKS